MTRGGKKSVPTPHHRARGSVRESAALAALERRAARQGVRPLSFDELLGEPDPDQSPEEVRREVNEFLVMLRGWRGLRAIS